MKKTLSLILAMLMALSTISCLSVVSLGADIPVTELENNDSISNSQTIATNETYTGFSASNEDKDWYTFDVTGDYFIINFGLNENDSLAGTNYFWNVTVESADGNYSETFENVKSLASAEIPFTGKIYITVSPHFYSSDKIIGVKYDLKITTVVNDHWEDEPNNETINPMAINTNETYTGSIHNFDDVDCYTFDANEDYFVIEFNLNENSFISGTNYYWDVVVKSANGNYSETYENVKSLTSAEIPFTGKMFITVSRHFYSSDTMNYVKYDLTVATTANDHWEDEPNNKTSNPMAINTNETYTGAIHNSNDKDCYTFDATEDYFVIKFNLNEKSSIRDTNYYWDVKITSEDGNYSETYENVKSLTSAEIPFTGKMFITVSRHFYSQDTMNYVKYDLKVVTTVNDCWENEINNNTAKAMAINTNKTYTGSIHNSDDIDSYVFEANDDYFVIQFGLNISSSISGTNYYWDVKLESADGIYSKTFSNVKSLTSAEIPYTGKMYISVSRHYYSQDTMNYVKYDLRVNTFKDAYWENEHNNAQTDATKIKVGSTYTGNITLGAGDVDYYKFTSTSAAFKLKFSLNPEEVSSSNIKNGWNVKVYLAEDPTLVLCETTVKTLSGYESITLPYGKGKDFIVKISSASTNADNAPIGVRYNLKIENVAGSKKWELENKKTDLASATKVSIGDKLYGNFYSSTDVDTFKISIPAGGNLSVKFNRTVSDITGDGWKLSIQDATGSYVAQNINLGNSLNATYTHTLKKGGTYYVRLESVSTRNAPESSIIYNLTFNYKMTTPKLSVKNTTNGVELRWNEIKDCTGYYVYRKAGNGNWSRIATLKNSTVKKSNGTVIYTDAKAKSGTRYTYKVRAYDGSYLSDFSSLKTVTFLSAPTAKTIKTAKAGITFTWSKVSGATGYEVYRKADNGSYKKIATAKKGTLVSFVDKSAKKGTTYTYRVRAINQTGTSAFSSTKTIRDKY